MSSEVCQTQTAPEARLGSHSAIASQLLEEGQSLLNEMRATEAEAVLRHACALEPLSAVAHYKHGLALGDLGRVEDALAAYDRAAALAPTDAKVHNNRGSALQQLGRMHDAESAFRTAQLLRPDAAPPYINLGHLLENAGRKEEAAKLYRTAILRGLDPDLFSQYLAALSAADAPDRSPDSWVRATFDNFAPSFDRHLRALRYRVPELLADAVAAVGRPPGDVADLGCGTGLCGAAIAGQRPRSITGVDLSPAMLALANSRRVYTTLVENEVHKWLAQTEAATLDLVLAADVFIYVGNLDALFELVGRVLRSGGLFGFSVERDDASDYSLRATGRYAQSASYINRLASRQFDTLVCQAQIIRNESAVAVDGLLYLLQARF